MTELVSVIVPTHNEQETLSAAIGSAREDDSVEVIVADGGSTDATRSIAHHLSDRVVLAPRHRAVQLNAGAAIAQGSILLFLHADSRLAPGSVSAVRRTMGRSEAPGGAFTLRIGDGSGGLNLISWGTNARARWLGLPYGDQALFARATVFHSLEGFRPMAIMEDVDFVRRMRRLGQIVLVNLPVETSARRWRRHGLLRTTFANASALAMFKLGMAPDRIRRYYDCMLPRRTHRA